MKAKEFIPQSKPRNFVAKNQKTAGAGAHKDKKRAEKQGDVKHKNKMYDESVAEGVGDKRTDPAPGKEFVSNKFYVKFTPDRIEFYRKGELVYTKSGDYSNPTRGDYSVAKGITSRLWEKEYKQGVAEGDKEIARTHKGGIVTKTAKGIKHTKTDYDDEGMGWRGKDKTSSDKSPYKKFPILDKDIDEGVSEGEATLSKIAAAGDDGYDMIDDGLNGLLGGEAEIMLQDMYNEISIEYRLHPDDDFEKIIDRMMDRIENDYGNNMSERFRDPKDWDEGNTEPPNNFAVYINGKKWKVFQGRGTYADDAREMAQYYKLQDWARKKSQDTGKKWEVSRTGEPATESIKEDTNIPFNQCPHCSGPIFHESLMNEKQDACYHKVRSRYKVWPSAYASGALVQCRKKGAKNWGNKGKK